MGREPGKISSPWKVLWKQSSCTLPRVYALQETLTGQLGSGKGLLAAMALQANKS